MVRFLLNETEELLSDVNPNLSVLEYLREIKGHSGTKEGCASGDCGACTVVLGEAVGDSIQYNSVNACITPIGNIHGKQLITVEHLKTEDGLHPTQQAMVDCHGSQCGFCTPGFVMSLFAYRKHHEAPERESLIEALGGNLCRCTGYRPILDAGVAMYEPMRDDQFTNSEVNTLKQLREIASDNNAVTLESGTRRYYAPSSANELAELLADNPQATMVAGGTDLCLEFTQFLREVDTLVYTGRARELLQITETDDSIEIGAAVSFSQMKETLCKEYPDLHELIDRLGSRQIRNQGTLGGNIANASPIGDMPPVLVALNAQLLLRSSTGSRTLSVEEYFISYKVTALEQGEFIQSIIVPRQKARYSLRAYKISKRLEDDISAVCGVFNIQIDDGRVADVSIAFGGMAEIPKRASNTEVALRGKDWSQDSVNAAITALATDFSPIDDFRASARYRMQCAQNLLQRLFLETQPGAESIRVSHYA
ncbi:MAG: xanthine dehydrogenase small subunit [Halioglobus sp.]